MKNKKGFTLVELLVVIALIGLLIAIAIPSGLKVSKKIKINMMNTKIETIEQGAIVWGQNNKKKLTETCLINGENYKCITKTIAQLLNEENAFEEDEKEGTIKILKNPINNKNINECNVTIYIKNKRVYAKYNQTGLCYIENTFAEPQEGTLLAGIKNKNEVEETETKPGEYISSSTEAVLSSTEDNYGTTYYFRGNVQNNYLTFANMCWRIVRIQGDGSIKLILEDKDEKCNPDMDRDWSISTGYYGYSDSNSGIYKADYLTSKSNSMSNKFKKFQIEKLGEYLSKLKKGDWCIETNNTYDPKSSQLLTDEIKNAKYSNKEQMFYEPKIRLNDNNPSLKCSNDSIINEYRDGTNMYVGTLTADEITFAGAKQQMNNNSFYLYSQNASWLTLSPSYYDLYAPYGNGYDRVFYVISSSSDGHYITSIYVTNYSNLRPAISLLAETKFKEGGDGTINKPYVVE